MFRPRVIPCLLLKGAGFYKTERFQAPKYLGDPMNILRIFNDKEVDELAILDIGATPNGNEPQFKFLEEIASECFMPVGYGGGVKTLEEAKRIFGMGYEKVILNSAAVARPTLISEIAEVFGSQGVTVSIDVKKNLFGKYEVLTCSGSKKTGQDPVQWAREAERRGAGEIFVMTIDRDGTQKGYDLDLIAKISSVVGIPVVASGGAGCLDHLREAVEVGSASAVAGGSFFVFQGVHRAVLISYPSEADLTRAFEGLC